MEPLDGVRKRILHEFLFINLLSQRKKRQRRSDFHMNANITGGECAKVSNIGR